MATLIEIESWEGEWFTITGPGKGDRRVWLSGETAPTGLWDAPVSTIYNSTAFQDGADYGGDRYDKRVITFDVEIYGNPDNPWERAWSDWVRAFRTDRDSKIWYTTDNSRRFLKVRKSKQATMQPTIDPEKTRHATVSMELVSGDPWWYEDSDLEEFITTTDTTSTSPVVYESSTIKAWNDGPLLMYPEWLFQGVAGIKWRIADYSFDQEEMHDRDEGVDATRVIQMAPTIDGEHVYVDTDPMAKDGQFISSLDTEYGLRMNGVRFMYPVPVYTGTKSSPILLPVSVTGAPIGSGIQLRMRRAWPTPMGLW